jgi:hypothetical protein
VTHWAEALRVVKVRRLSVITMTARGRFILCAKVRLADGLLIAFFGISLRHASSSRKTITQSEVFFQSSKTSRAGTWFQRRKGERARVARSAKNHLIRIDHEIGTVDIFVNGKQGHNG